jgi:hypothetical protein
MTEQSLRGWVVIDPWRRAVSCIEAVLPVACVDHQWCHDGRDIVAEAGTLPDLWGRVTEPYAVIVDCDRDRQFFVTTVRECERLGIPIQDPTDGLEDSDLSVVRQAVMREHLTKVAAHIDVLREQAAELPLTVGIEINNLQEVLDLLLHKLEDLNDGSANRSFRVVATGRGTGEGDAGTG